MPTPFLVTEEQIFEAKPKRLRIVSQVRFVFLLCFSQYNDLGTLTPKVYLSLRCYRILLKKGWRKSFPGRTFLYQVPGQTTTNEKI